MKTRMYVVPRLIHDDMLDELWMLNFEQLCKFHNQRDLDNFSIYYNDITSPMSCLLEIRYKSEEWNNLISEIENEKV